MIIDFNVLIEFLSIPGDKQNHVRGSKSTKISGRTFTQTSREGNSFTGYAAGSAWGGGVPLRIARTHLQIRDVTANTRL